MKTHPIKDLASFKLAIDRELERAYLSAFEMATKVDPLYAELIREMQTLTARGGKRLRPYIAYLAYRGSGGEKESSILKAVSGLELFHTFLLIHDDIMDRDETRYGGPTVSARYKERLAVLKAIDHDHFAMSAALLAGDAGSALARLQLSGSDFPAESRLKALEELDSTLFLTCGGQFIDGLAPHLMQKSLKKEHILSIYTHKTALYSFDLPLRTGLILAGAAADRIAASRNISIPLGIAYQMRDDYLGVFGSEKKTGKSATGDIREGKQTYLHALAIEKLSPSKRKELTGLYGNPAISSAGAERVRELFRESGACQELEVLIADYSSQAQKALHGSNLSSAVRGILEGLIKVGLRREI